MGKINKFANLYDHDGKILKHVNDQGILTDYNVEELEQLVDKLGNDKDENGNIKDPQAFNNASQMLFTYYMKYGYPHADELKAKLAEEASKKTDDKEVLEKLEQLKGDLSVDEIKAALNAVEEQIDKEQNKTILNDHTVTDEYVDFEEVPVDNNTEKEAA